MFKVSVDPVKTSVFAQGGDLNFFLKEHLSEKLQEGDVLAISTKVVSLAENQIVSSKDKSKEEIVKEESDQYLGEIGYGIFLTIKQGLFIPSAGIDASNAEKEHFIVYPKDPFTSAKNIWQFLRKEFSLQKLGVILVDSHTTPLRRGTTGIGVSYWGFAGVKDYRGTPDLLGNPLEYTFLNVVDSLSCMANYCMGEGNELIPLTVIRGANVEFNEDTDPKEIQIPLQEDLYYPIFKGLVEE